MLYCRGKGWGPVFSLTGIVKAYGGSQVLSGVDLELTPGRAVCIAGANATGKTTLLTIAAGLQKPDSGSVRAEGRVGFVPQESALLDDLTVNDNLALWYAANRRPAGELFGPRSAETALGLSAYRRRRVAKLSGGIKKRASISAALTGDPDWLLMDEPFAALDLQSRQEISALLAELKRRGKGLCFSSHDPAAIAACADCLLLLKGGGIARTQPLAGDEPSRTAAVLELLSQA